MARATVRHRHDGTGARWWHDDMGVLRRGGSVARRRGGIAQRERQRHVWAVVCGLKHVCVARA